MARIITKGLIGTQDLSIGTSTFTRATSVGGTQVLNQISGIVQVAAVPVDLVAQSANIATANLIAGAAVLGGFYNIKIAINATQAATTSSTRPKVTIGYTDADSNTAITVDAVGPDSHNNLTTPDYISLNINAKAGVAVTYATSGYISNGATPMQYALHVRSLGPL